MRRGRTSGAKALARSPLAGGRPPTGSAGGRLALRLWPVPHSQGACPPLADGGGVGGGGVGGQERETERKKERKKEKSTGEGDPAREGRATQAARTAGGGNGGRQAGDRRAAGGHSNAATRSRGGQDGQRARKTQKGDGGGGPGGDRSGMYWATYA